MLIFAPEARQKVSKQLIAVTTDEVSEAKTVESSAYIDTRASVGGESRKRNAFEKETLFNEVSKRLNT